MRSKEQRSLSAERESSPSHGNGLGDDKRYERAPGICIKPAPEKWCALEILGHLADVEIIYGYRLRQMLADTKQVIAPIDQDAWSLQPELLGFASFGASGVLWVGTSSQLAAASKSEGF